MTFEIAMGMRLVTVGSLQHQVWHRLSNYSSVEPRDQKWGASMLNSAADFQAFLIPEGGERKYLKSKELGLEGGQVTGALAHFWSKMSFFFRAPKSHAFSLSWKGEYFIDIHTYLMSVLKIHMLIW